MKNTILAFRLLLLLLFAFGASQQVNAGILAGYTFSQNTSGTYTPLTSGTVLASGAGLDSQRYAVTLPFTFSFDNVNYTNIYASINGFLSLGTIDPGPGYWMINSPDTGFRVISGFDANLASHAVSTSELKYATLGTTPNRVFVMQWSNFGIPASNDLNASFQIRLYETSNKIDISYGNITLANNSLTGLVQVGLRSNTRQEFNSRYSYYTNGWIYTMSGTNSSYGIDYYAGNNPPAGLLYTFTPPAACTSPAAVTNLQFTPTPNSIYGIFSVPGWMSGYIVIASQTGPVNAAPVNGVSYPVGTVMGNGTVIANTNANNFNHTGLNPNSSVYYAVYSYNVGACIGSPAYSTTALTGIGQTTGPRKYTWLPVSGSADFTLAANWQPARTYVNAGDTLLFVNGGNSTATNVPAISARQISIGNNTALWLQGGTSGDIALSDSLTVAAGSSLTLAGTSVMRLRFINSQSGLVMNGTLRVLDNGIFDGISPSGIIGGTLIDSGYNVSSFKTSANKLRLKNGAYYIHGRDGGEIPLFIYDTASNLVVTGVKNTSPAYSGGLNITLGNLEWNCPGQQIATGLWYNTTIAGNFVFKESNNQAVSISNLLTVKGNLVQHGGWLKVVQIKAQQNIQLNGGVLQFFPGGASGIEADKNITQAAPHVISQTTAGTTNFTFKGIALQELTLNGTIDAAARISYVLNNAAGVQANSALYLASGANMTIKAGVWSGTGIISYGSNTQLIYASAQPVTATDKEWPALSGPAHLNLVLTGTAPYNRLAMPGARTLSGSCKLDNGVLVLNGYDLIASQVTTTTAGSNTMVAADSTGHLKLNFGAGNWVKTFPVGNLGQTPIYSPVTLTVRNNVQDRIIGVNLKGTKHSQNNAVATYLKRYWSFTDSNPGAGFEYDLALAHDNDDKAGNGSYSLACWNSVLWNVVPSYTAYYPYSIYEAELHNVNAINGANTPLDNATFSGIEIPGTIYSWTGGVNYDFTVPGNWTPHRDMPSVADVLQFNSGGTDTVKNIPTQYISRMVVGNNTTVSLQGAAGVNNTLFLGNDQDTTTNELQVDYGSNLYFNGQVGQLYLQFTSSPLQHRAYIGGRLEAVTNSTVQNRVYFQNCIATMSPQSVLAVGGAVPGAVIAGNPASTLMYGTYEFKFGNGGVIDAYTWMEGSRIIVSKTVAGGTLQLPYTPIRNFIYDCPDQTGVLTLVNNYPMVKDTFKVVNTGSSLLRLTSNVTMDFTVRDFLVTGGVVDLSNGTGFYPQSLSLEGDFVQTGGQFYCSGVLTNNNVPELHFKGSNGMQHAWFRNSAPAGAIMYRVSNLSGVEWNGTGSFGTNFNINAKGGVRISSIGAYPVKTNLKLVYDPTASTLVYDAAGDCVADSTVFPAQAGPQNLTVNILANRSLTLPFNRTVPGTLRMGSGNINLGGGTLTLGASVSTPGTLSWVSGYININGGLFKRWIGNGGLPSTPGTSTGYFPLGYNGQNRSVAMYLTTASALTSGGTLAIGHTPLPGLSTGFSIPDGSTTLTARTNTSWTFNTGNGFTLTSPVAACKIGASELLVAVNPATAHIMQQNAAPGTHLAGSGTYPDYTLQRAGLSNADLNGTFYAGLEQATGGVFTSVITGNWNNAATWDVGAVPGAGDMVIVSGGTTVTTSPNSHAAHLTVRNGGILNNPSGVFTVDSNIDNSGTITIGGIFTLGPTGGGKPPFLNKGTLNLTGGKLTINGWLNNTNTSAFNQTGGDLVIDGNKDGIAAQSAPGAVLSFYSPAITLSAGNIHIVDGSVTGNYEPVIRTSIATTVRANLLHNIYLGDGISVAPGILGLSLSIPSQGGIIAGNLIVKGTPNTPNFRGVLCDEVTIGGNISVTNAGLIYGGKWNLEGNLNVDSGGAFRTFDAVTFKKQLPVAGYAPQLISGKGEVNLNTYIINNNAGGILANIGDVKVSSVTFVSGNLNIGAANTLIINGIGSIYGAGKNTGWLIGKVFYNVNAGGALNFLFPFGDMQHYTPVSLWGSSIQFTNSGVRGALYPTDHPSVYSSAILPARSINQYFELDMDPNFSFVQGTGNLSFEWDSSAADAGITPSAVTAAVLQHGSWNTLNNTTAGNNTLQITGLTGNFPGSYQLGNLNPAAPAIASQPKDSLICSGSNAAFKVVLNNSAGYQYQWQRNTLGGNWNNLVNGGFYAGVTDSILTVSAADTTLHNSRYRCVMVKPGDTVYSGIAVLGVLNYRAPVVVLTSSAANDTICTNGSITFSANISNGGDAPVIKWKKNGTIIATGAASTLTVNNLLDKDTVSCEVTSNALCLSATQAVSNKVITTVLPNGAVVVSLVASPGTTVCTGTNITVTASATFTGANPTYTWYMNSNPVGTNSPVYTVPAALLSGSLYCSVSSSYQCVSGPAVGSAALYLSTAPPVTPGINISSFPTSACSGSTVTFYASGTNTGSAPVYQWKINGVNAGAPTSQSAFSTTTLANNDTVTCVLTSSAPCVLVNNILSNAIVTPITPSVTPVVTIAASDTTICSGTAVTFTSNVTGQGTILNYYWRINGSMVGYNATLTTSGLNDNDVATLEIYTDPLCATTNNVTSNGITFTVYPTMAPTLVIAAAPGTTVCSGTPVTYTATVTGPLPGMAYEWYLNGTPTGVNSLTYTNNNPIHQDLVYCEVQATNACGGTSLSNSNTLTLTVNSSAAPTVSIAASPGNVVSAGVPVTFTATATNEGLLPVYKWLKNGVDQGVGGSVYTTSNLQTNDTIEVELNSSEPCVAPPVAASNRIVMTVITGLNGIDKNFSDIGIYPNPNNGSFTIKGALPAGMQVMDAPVQLFSSIGQLIYATSISISNGKFEQQLVLPDNIAQGIYLLKMQFGDQVLTANITVAK